MDCRKTVQWLCDDSGHTLGEGMIHMTRGKQIGKIFRAIELYSKPSGATIAQSMEELECDRRSVYRMMNSLQEMGFPLYDESSPLGREKRWKLPEEYVLKLPNISLPNLDINWPEVFALHLMRAQDEVFKGTGITEAADRALAKLGVLLPENFSDKLSRVKALCTPMDKFSKDYSDKGDVIDALAEAAISQTVCRLKYDSFSKEKQVEFSVAPLTFFENRGGLYIFVNATDYGNIRVLAVERILEVVTTGDNFEMPEGFDPADILNGAFNITLGDPVHAKIWISASQARYILQRKYFKKQSVQNQPDGSIILEIDTSGWFDLKQWVLALGAEAKVLEPEALRQDLAEEVRKMAESLEG